MIIPEKDYDRWLKPDPERSPIDLLRPFDPDKMTAWKGPPQPRRNILKDRFPLSPGFIAFKQSVPSAETT